MNLVMIAHWRSHWPLKIWKTKLLTAVWTQKWTYKIISNPRPFKPPLSKAVVAMYFPFQKRGLSQVMKPKPREQQTLLQWDQAMHNNCNRRQREEMATRCPQVVDRWHHPKFIFCTAIHGPLITKLSANPLSLLTHKAHRKWTKRSSSECIILLILKVFQYFKIIISS